MGQALNTLRSLSTPVKVLLCMTLLWMGMIFWMSAQNADDSGDISRGLLKTLLSLVTPGWSEMTGAQRRAKINACHILFRKLGHFSEYTVLGALLTGVLRWKHTERQPAPFFRVWIPALCALCYAVTDELHQRFVPGRSCELRDVLIDFSGALLGIGIVLLMLHRYRKRRCLQ